MLRVRSWLCVAVPSTVVDSESVLELSLSLCFRFGDLKVTCFPLTVEVNSKSVLSTSMSFFLLIKVVSLDFLPFPFGTLGEGGKSKLNTPVLWANCVPLPELSLSLPSTALLSSDLKKRSDDRPLSLRLFSFFSRVYKSSSAVRILVGLPQGQWFLSYCAFISFAKLPTKVIAPVNFTWIFNYMN